MQTIHIINFGTDEHYQKNFGTKYYCSNNPKVKQILRKLLEGNKNIKELMRQYGDQESKRLRQINDNGLFIEIEEVNIL